MGKVLKIETTEILPRIDQKLVAEAIKEIRNAGQNATTAYLQLARTIRNWRDKKEWDEIEEILLSKQLVSDSVLKKLILIGSNPVLMDESNWAKLPIGYNHLYPFTQIEPDKLTELIEDGKIHNGLSVKESNELKDRHRTKKKPSQRTPKSVQFTIKIKLSSNTKGVQTLLKSQVYKLKVELGKLDKSSVVELS
jgi:hypothetical protein